MTSALHDRIDRAGNGSVLMVSPEARRDIRSNSSVHDWCFLGNREFYRGASVEVHDEWSWGWMVRKADGKYVEAAITAGSRRAKTAKLVECEASQSGPKASPRLHRLNTPLHNPQLPSAR